MKKTIIVSILFLTILLFGCTSTQSNNTFQESNTTLCKIDDKPIIRMYSTTWCPHCKWAGPVFDKVVKEYLDKNLIIANHFEVDILDDKLTDINEGSISESEYSEFLRVSPKGSIPAYSFGCKYIRVGNGYEQNDDLVSEENEFRRVIDKLIDSAKNN